jgi:hypothetical protein
MVSLLQNPKTIGIFSIIIDWYCDNFIVIYFSMLMGLKTKVFLLIPLTVFATIIFGLGMYMTLCKNSNIPLLC